ncbi:MAG TPA: glycosyltransferase [Mycobacteriales bacterium]|nr:glycosyltransferase [Mycobacteriales bacterium]
MYEAEVPPAPLDDFLHVLTPQQVARFEAAAARARDVLAGRTVWNISSTETGGGVAEMLHSLLGYVGAAGVSSRWLIISGDSRFFEITKRLHNAVHGFGDVRLVPGAADHGHYQQIQDTNLPGVLAAVRPGDLAVLHDPQPAGLVKPLQQAGLQVIWRSHIGRDQPNEQSTGAWDFIRRYVDSADAFVFSRPQYAPAWVPADRLRVIPPSIDPLSTKNRLLAAEEQLRILVEAGLLAGNGAAPAGVVTGAPAPTPDTRLVVQVSRWDRLKDMAGVMAGFCLVAPDVPDAHLMLVGPATAGVTDDPEGADVFAECVAAWQDLAEPVRSRVHLVSVPMVDVEKNAAVVNAIQRHASVVTQKSLVEGFGLTVAEAMWKARPVVASAVGGIQDQIRTNLDGLLLPDPTDLDHFGQTLRTVLTDDGLAHRLGVAAKARVHDQFLGDRHLTQYADLIESLLGTAVAD